MAGTISSLGIGSGVLTAEVIDQLRANEETALLNPIDKKISDNKARVSAFSAIESLMEKLQTSAANLSDPYFFSKRTTTVDGIGASVTAVEGTIEQSFSLTTNTLAKKHIMESSNSYGASTDFLRDSGTMTITMADSTVHNIAYDTSMTLDDLVNEINTVAGANVTASALTVAPGDTRLILTSNETGTANAIQSVADSAATEPFAFTDAQGASDATFTFNGIDITRSTNEITDLITGATITLLKEGETTNVTIDQDKEAIEEEVKGFVDNYNALIDKIKVLTAADPDEGTAGILNGDSFVRSITRSISSLVSSFTSASGETMLDFGIELDRYGKMSVDTTTFMEKYNADPAAAELFLIGDATNDGLFTQVDASLDTYLSYNGLMDTYTGGIDERTKSLEEQRERTLALIEKRYESMTQRFIAYDAMISKMNSSFGILQQQIQMAVNSDN